MLLRLREYIHTMYIDYIAPIGSVKRFQVALLCNSAGFWRMAVRNRRTLRNWAETCYCLSPAKTRRLVLASPFSRTPGLISVTWGTSRETALQNYSELVYENTSWNNLPLEIRWDKGSYQFSHRAIQWSAGRDGSAMIFAFVSDLGLSKKSGIPHTVPILQQNMDQQEGNDDPPWVQESVLVCNVFLVMIVFLIIDHVIFAGDHFWAKPPQIHIPFGSFC